MKEENIDKYTIIDFISVVLILLSIALLVIQSKLPNHYALNEKIYSSIDLIIVIGFALDYIFRILRTNGGKKYVLSWAGIIDVIAFAPSLISLVSGINLNSSWLRSIRLIRLIKVLTISKHIDSRLGVFTYLVPYLVTAVAFKGVVLVYEGSDWWPQIGNINTVLGVTGFAVAIAMGTKLSVVNNRIYAIEDAICRVIGAIRDIENSPGVKDSLVKWTIQLEHTLKVPQEDKPIAAAEMRLKTDNLEKVLEKNNVSGPATAGFHRDVAFLLHRITATTPAAFDHFLRIMTVIYSLTLILTIPGITGLFSSILVVLSLGGLFYINQDMDQPLDYSIGSLFDVRLDALEQFNHSRAKV